MEAIRSFFFLQIGGEIKPRGMSQRHGMRIGGFKKGVVWDSASEAPETNKGVGTHKGQDSLHRGTIGSNVV